MKPRKTQSQRIDETREKLRSAAFRLLIERGFANFRFAEVSQASGVSRGGMLHHYPSKDALVADVLRNLFAELEDRNAERREAATDIDRTVKATVASGQDFFYGKTFPIFIDVWLASHWGNQLPESFEVMNHYHHGLLADFWIDALVERGVSPDVAARSVRLIWTVLRGIGIRSFGQAAEEHTDEIVALAVESAERYIAADQAGAQG